MNPLAIRVAAVFITLVLTFGSGAYLGYHYADNACKASKLDVQEAAIEKHDKAADIGLTVEKETVQKAAKTEAVFNGIQRGIIDYAKTHPVSTDCHLDADGMRLWAAANANTDPQPSTERDAGVRAAPASAEQRDDGSTGQPYRRGQGLSPVPRSAPRFDQLAGKNK